jgi:hypothetical protein
MRTQQPQCGAVAEDASGSGTLGIKRLSVAQQAIREALHVQLPHVALPVRALGFLLAYQHATVLLK